VTGPEASYVFGRAGGDADVQINDDYLSKRHCRVWQDATGTWVEDLGSPNGTWIGGGPLQGGRRVYGPTRLVPGDVLYIGRTTIPWER
jgi:pSer/pThr/pTyr-binding forkhead associated (FHA) protein